MHSKQQETYFPAHSTQEKDSFLTIREDLLQYINTKNWKETYTLITLIENKIQKESKLFKDQFTIISYMLQFKPPLYLVKYVLRNFKQERNTIDEFGFTPLHTAVKYEASTKIVSYLMKQDKLSCQKKDNDGNTPLHHAVLAFKINANLYDKRKSQLQLIKVLSREAPASIYIKNKRKLTPFDIAIEECAPMEVLTMLWKCDDRAKKEKTKEKDFGCYHVQKLKVQSSVMYKYKRTSCSSCA